ncbi:uncharacterized protein LOC130704358 [Daphnia carinata]|uniref:uncharacterized protein LOC130704358 n=1 Tax=Daphnia carinata TaxID=120202 RepID=UPI00257AD5A2|nr:uncharacterized protein LOC130704358 [Daphnia carinata]
MLWKDEPCPPIETPSKFENQFRKSISTQTMEIAENMELNTSESECVELETMEAENVEKEKRQPERVDVENAEFETVESEPAEMQMDADQNDKQNLCFENETGKTYDSDGDVSIADDMLVNQHNTTPIPENNVVAIDMESETRQVAPAIDQAEELTPQNATGRPLRNRRLPIRYRN